MKTGHKAKLDRRHAAAGSQGAPVGGLWQPQLETLTEGNTLTLRPTCYNGGGNTSSVASAQFVISQALPVAAIAVFVNAVAVAVTSVVYYQTGVLTVTLPSGALAASATVEVLITPRAAGWTSLDGLQCAGGYLVGSTPTS